MLWESLLEKLSSCHKMLSTMHDLMTIFTEMDDCLANMSEVEVVALLVYEYSIPFIHSTIYASSDLSIYSYTCNLFLPIYLVIHSFIHSFIPP